MQSLPLFGTFTALVTPFVDGGVRIDERALERLVEEQISAGVTGLVPCGTTGEAPTLSDDEQISVIRSVVEVARGRCAVLAGTGSFSTEKTIKASKAAIKAGASGIMVVMPYYNKPSQEGLQAHVLAVADAVSAPIVLYNIPGRSAVDLAADTTERICEHTPHVVGIKDATGNVLRCQELLRRLGSRITILSGDDSLTVAMMSVGARGVISVTSNVRPRATVRVTEYVRQGQWEHAKNEHFALLPLHYALFEEPNPAPAKALLALEGKMTKAVRAPLLECSEALTQKIARLAAEVPLA